MQHYRLGATWVYISFAEGGQGSEWTLSSPRASNAPLQQRRSTASWASLRGVLPAS